MPDMNDYYPAVARGVRHEDGIPAPPRPDEDERWEYLADHLRAIRATLGILAFIAVCQVVGAVLWLAMVSLD